MIDKHIAELLKTNTRVIVPDFGAFMVKTTPGTSEKQISFNDFLKYNDGLLINHIAKVDGVIKEDAQKKVKTFVENIQKELKENKPFKIEGLGYLYKDPRGSVKFKDGDKNPVEQSKSSTKPSDKSEPALKASEQKPKTSVTLDDKAKETPTTKIGVPTPKKPDDKKTTPETKTLNDKLGDKKPSTTPQAKVRTGAPEAKKTTTPVKKTTTTGAKPTTKTPQTKTPQKQNNSTTLIITAAVVVVVGVAAVIGYLNWNVVQSWFGKSTVEKDKPQKTVVDSATIKARQARLDSIKSVQIQRDSIEKAKQDSIQKSEELKKKNQKKYYLVAGSFKTRKYAQMFVDKLKKQGYNSEIFMERRGFYRVSYNSYVDRQEAFNEYRRMKNQDVQVWVFRH